jgi:predicted permease
MRFDDISATARAALKQLIHEPIYSLTTIATLSIGIASASAIFSVVRGVILRPLPYSDPSSIVAIQEYQPKMKRDQSTIASANLPRLATARSFSSVSAFTYSEFVLSGDGDAERVLGARIDGKLLDVLGVRPALGRGIVAEETGAMPARVAVVSDGLWRKRFGGTAAAVGQSIAIDGVPHSIIGVMPASFEFPRNPSMTRDVDVWVPRRPPNPMMMRRGMRDLTVIARRRAGLAIDDAQRELDAIADRAALDDARLNDGWHYRARDLRDVIVAPVRPVLGMLAVCVVVLLIISTGNASASALARITAKRQSFGVRLALGASNARLTAMLFVESLTLALAAAVVALPMGVVLRGLLVRSAPVVIPRQSGIVVDGWTILITLATAALAGILTALGPAAWLRLVDPRQALSDGGRTAIGSRHGRRGLSVFVMGQLGLGTVLLAATAGVYATYARLNHVDPGFTSQHVASATLALGGARYQNPVARAQLTSQLLTKVRAIRDVQSAAVTSLLPLSGGLMSSSYGIVGGASDSSNSAALRAVSADFFRTLGIPIRQGRPVDDSDDERASPVVVLNEAMARQAFGNVESPVARSISVTPPGSDSAKVFQVVGIAGNAKEKDLAAPDSPVIYFSDRQASFPHAVLVVRTKGAFPQREIRVALRELDPSLALDDIMDLEQRVHATYALEYFLLLVLGAFAVSGAMMIGVGVYGAMAFVMSTEMRGFGIRIALGATPRTIFRQVIGRTGLLALGGCVAGAAVALALPRVLEVDQRFGNGLGFGAVMWAAACVLLIGLVATVIPALRASSVDPVTLLREG